MASATARPEVSATAELDLGLDSLIQEFVPVSPVSFPAGEQGPVETILTPLEDVPAPVSEECEGSESDTDSQDVGDVVGRERSVLGGGHVLIPLEASLPVVGWYEGSPM